jgi:hypothetical protein
MSEKRPSKTAAELEASIKVEMEDICDWPTDMMVSVQPDGDSWKLSVTQEGSVDNVDRREMVEQIAARLRAEYVFEGLTSRALSCRQRRPAAPLNVPAFHGSPIRTDVGHCRDARSIPAREQALQKCCIAPQ